MNVKKTVRILYLSNGVFAKINDQLSNKSDYIFLDERPPLLISTAAVSELYDGPLETFRETVLNMYRKNYRGHLKGTIDNFLTTSRISLNDESQKNFVSHMEREMINTSHITHVNAPGCCGASMYTGMANLFVSAEPRYDYTTDTVNQVKTRPRYGLFNGSEAINNSNLYSYGSESFVIYNFKRNLFLKAVRLRALQESRNIVILSDSSNEAKFDGLDKFKALTGGQNFKTSNIINIYVMTIADIDTLLKQGPQEFSDLKPSIITLANKIKCKIQEEISFADSLAQTQKSSSGKVQTAV